MTPITKCHLVMYEWKDGLLTGKHKDLNVADFQQQNTGTYYHSINILLGKASLKKNTY